MSAPPESPTINSKEERKAQLLEQFPDTDPSYVFDVLRTQRWIIDDAVQILLMTETPAPSASTTTAAAPVSVPPPPAASAARAISPSNLGGVPAKLPAAIHRNSGVLSGAPQVPAPLSIKVPSPAAVGSLPAPLIKSNSMTSITSSTPFIGQIGVTINRRLFADQTEDQIVETARQWFSLGSHIAVPYVWSEKGQPVDKLAQLIVKGLQRAYFTPIFVMSSDEYARVPNAIKPSLKVPKAQDQFTSMALALAASKPAYLCLMYEANVHFNRTPDELDLFFIAYKTVYQHVKQISPSTKVFVSFNFEALNSAVSQRILDVLTPYLDLFAFSTFPSDKHSAPSAIPADYYASLASYVPANTPVAVLGTGWGSERSEPDQREFIGRLAQLLGATGVAPVWACWTEAVDLLSPNQTMGLIASDGKSKLARSEWEQLHLLALTNNKSPAPSPKPVAAPANRHVRNLSSDTKNGLSTLLPPPIAPDAKSGSLPAPINRKSPNPVAASALNALAQDVQGLYVGPTAPAPTYAPVDSYATLKSVPAAIPTDTVTAFEFEGFVLSKARDLLERRPIYDVVLQTPEAPLLTAKIAHEIVRKMGSLHKQASIPSMPDMYDGKKLADFISASIDGVAAEVLNNKAWLANVKARFANEVPFAWQSAEDQGPRPYMEDRSVVLPYLDIECGLELPRRLSYFAVFDGHGGTAVAEYVASHVHVNFVRSNHFPNNIRAAISEAFTKTNEAVFKFLERRDLPLNVGSTGLICVLYGTELYVGWVGDTEASLIKKGGDVLKFVTCHKASSVSEQQRILAAGGTISEVNGMLRVNGMLAVSRAFGDQTLYPYVNAVPEIASYTIKGEEGLLVIGCDGLWDVFTPFEIEEFGTRYVSVKGSLAGMSENLAKFSRARGSTDNVSIIIVEFA